MPIVIANRRTSGKRLAEKYPDAPVLDVTSRGPEPWVRFSPFYPHGGIPVPFWPGTTSMSVEGIWQGLKVFANADVDPSKFEVRSMRGLKRSARSFGKVLGHRAGDRLTPYVEARHAIYLPAYRWVLDHCLADEVSELSRLAAKRDVVLLDYATNPDIDDPRKPLSHAALIKAYVEDSWPASKAAA